MKLSKKFFGKLLMLVAFFAIGGFLLPAGEAQAYFSKNGDKQCFAVQYLTSEAYEDQGKSADSGNTPKDRTKTKVYSTDRVCANVDSSGNITGGLNLESRGQSGTTYITPNDNSPNLFVNGTKVSIRTCKGTGPGCTSSMKVAKTVDAKNGANFQSLMKELQGAAPKTTSLDSKASVMGFDDNRNTSTTQKEADEKDGVDTSGASDCKASGGAKALGWIVCPVLEWMGEAAANIYNEYVEPSLQIEPQLFKGGNESVRTAWSTFQNFANIMFVILLLIVIFSQLTGVGIDNYGIKKILPKLILAAILINLSYLACLLLIDISNIFGNSFQGLFNGLADQLTLPGDITIDGGGGTSGTIQTAAITGLTGVGVLGAVVASAAAIFTNPAILLSMLVSALGIIIAVFFLFILLSAREAAIIVLTVISPLAVVAYILPNTKKMSDKWWQMFKGLLLVYPICGLLVGAGGYVSKLLLVAGNGSSGFISVFTSMIVSIVPIFFIPTVLKSSFAAMGNLGARISSFGQRVSGTATSAARNSGFYKNAQAAGLERQARIRGGLDANGNPTTGWRRRMGTVLSGGARMRQRNALNYNKMMRENGSLDATEGRDFTLATQTANVLTRLEADGTINNNDELEEGLQNALVNNNRPEIQAYTDALSAKGDSGRMAVRRAYDNAVKAGAMSDADNKPTDAARTFANNIMSKHAAEYKNKNRSMFDVASAISGNKVGSAVSMSSYAENNKANLAMKVTTDSLAAMDEQAFGEVFGGYDANGKATGDPASLPSGLNETQKMAIGESAFNALRDASNMKADRRALLQQLVNESGYSGGSGGAGTVAGGGNTGGGRGPVQGSAPSGYVERESGLIVPH